MLIYTGEELGGQSLWLWLAWLVQSGLAHSWPYSLVLLYFWWESWLRVGRFTVRAVDGATGQFFSASCSWEPGYHFGKRWVVATWIGLCCMPITFVGSSITVVVTVCLGVFSALWSSVKLFLFQPMSFALVFWFSSPSHQGQSEQQLVVLAASWKGNWG